MEGRRKAPFTNFVLALAHSGQSYAEFVGKADDKAVIEQWGITPDQHQAVKSGNLALIQEYVQQEVGGSPVAAAWIGNVPWPWIGA
jgi:hypothetical protein